MSCKKVRECCLPDFLPGRFTLSRGRGADYRSLAGFHYLGPKPATWAGVWTIRYRAGPRAAVHDPPRVVAIGVLSYPVPSCAGREKFLGRSHFTRKQNLAFANRHVRTISRVIVHPQFRALGLSTVLVRAMCRGARTRYVEALAAMGKIHPFFERAGMTRVDPENSSKPTYFIFDRKEMGR